MKFFMITLLYFFFFVNNLFSQIALNKIEILEKEPLPDLVKKGVLDTLGNYFPNPVVIIVKSDLENIKYTPIIRMNRGSNLDTLFLQSSTKFITIKREGFFPFTFNLESEEIYIDEFGAWKINIRGIVLKSVFTVTINVIPEDAEIIIDDKEIVTGRQCDLTKGKHRIKVSKNGYETYESDIYVDRTNTIFNIELAVNVYIQTTPDDALIYFKDKILAKNPLPLVPPGPYKFRAVKDKYITQTKSLYLSSKDTVLSINLPPKDVFYRRGDPYIGFCFPSLYVGVSPPDIGDYKLQYFLGIGVGLNYYIGRHLHIKYLFVTVNAKCAIGYYYFIENEYIEYYDYENYEPILIENENYNTSAFFPVEIETGIQQKIFINDAFWHIRAGHKILNYNFNDGLISNIEYNGYYIGAGIEIPTSEHSDLGISINYNILKANSSEETYQSLHYNSDSEHSYFSVSYYMNITF